MSYQPMTRDPRSAPPTSVRRMKTYTGSQGYVYQYYFVGKRIALPGDVAGPATEYVFDVTSDRKSTFAVSVFLQGRAVKQWAETHGRALNEAEHYAAAKLRLFQAFDEIENMMTDGRRLLIDADILEQALLTLGIS